MKIFSALLSMLALTAGADALAGGYTQDLFLCDVGIRSPGTAAALGVDYLTYKFKDKRLTLMGGMTLSSAVKAATDPYDRWDTNNQLKDVDLNLESDYYGTMYYLEYCYKWERVLPSDSVVYAVTLMLAQPSVPITHTNIAVTTTCVTKTAAGAFLTQNASDWVPVYTQLGTDMNAVRCTVRFTFNEVADGSRRPHSLDYENDSPQISVKVEP